MTSVLAPVVFDAPLVNPSPGGLFAVTSWTDAGEGEALRWLPSGVEIKPFNYGGEDSFGVWTADWCASEGDLEPENLKRSAGRPHPLDPFVAVTTWASDECDLSAASRAEVRLRAAQNHRLREPVAVAREFAARLLDDAGTPDTAADIVGAVSQLEASFAETNTVGHIHASPVWAASAAQAQLLRYSGSRLSSPLGLTWVFDGGYVDGLGDTLVGTSQPFGWRGPVSISDAEKAEEGTFYALVERSLLVGYEALVGAVTVTG
jgi:hypothetical protein